MKAPTSEQLIDELIMRLSDSNEVDLVSVNKRLELIFLLRFETIEIPEENHENF